MKPATLLGRKESTDQGFKQLEAGYFGKLTASEPRAVSGTYGSVRGGDAILFTAFPAGKVNARDWLERFTAQLHPGVTFAEVDPGKLGGAAHCLTGKSGKNPVVECLWASRDISAIIYFFNIETKAAPEMLVKAREQIEIPV